MSRKVRVPQKPKAYNTLKKDFEPEWKERKRVLRQKKVKKKIKYKQQLYDVSG